MNKQLPKIIHYGPYPDEADGGAAVNYGLLKMMHYLEPSQKHYVIPKNPEEANPSMLPFADFYNRNEVKIEELMLRYKIPLLEAFHIAENIEPYIDPVHEVGGKIVLHNTVHFSDDMLFRCKRLNDLDCVVTPTMWSKNQVAFHGNVSQDKIVMIPHGVDIEKFYPHRSYLRKQYGIGEDKTVVLFTGRYDLFKGIQQLISLIRPFTEQHNCVFMIKACSFGEGISRKLHSVFKRMATTNPNLILLDKWLPYDLMSEITACADVTLIPSGTEGFCVPLIESLACGIPTITTDLPNHREIVSNFGMLLQPTDSVGVVNQDLINNYEGTNVKVPSSNNIYEALKFLVENPEKRKIMGIEGRVHVEQNYALHMVADKWLNLFSELGNYDMDEALRDSLLKI